MFKLNGTRSTVIGQEISDEELSNVIGAQQQQSSDQKAFNDQFRETANDILELFAPVVKPIDSAIRLAGLGERLIQRGLDHDLRTAISDHEAAQREADEQEEKEQKEKDAAAERDRLLSSNNGGNNHAPADTQGGPHNGGGLPDIPSHMINAPPNDGVQIEITPVGGVY